MIGGEKVTDFEKIYRENFTDVYKYVYSLCRNAALAEEITQETFYKALRHIDGFDGRCRLYVWLCQIAKNTYYTYQKKQKRFADADIVFAVDDGLPDKEAAWELHRLIHNLSEPYKEVLTLRIFGELSFSQIGELFGKSDSWARLIFFRAKKEIRGKFNEN